MSIYDWNEEQLREYHRQQKEEQERLDGLYTGRNVTDPLYDPSDSADSQPAYRDTENYTHGSHKGRGAGVLLVLGVIVLVYARSPDEQLRSDGAPARESRPAAKTTSKMRSILGIWLGEDPAGILVWSVTNGGPADNAGIRKGDVIFQIDGVTVSSPRDLQDLIGGYEPRSQVRVSLYRRRAVVRTTATVAANENYGIGE